MLFSNNPFYILEIPCNINKAELSEKIDFLSFSKDPQVCANAQLELINPFKRLHAELNWFYNCNDISNILVNIENQELINTDNLLSISRLNACIYNFEISKDLDIYFLGYSISELNSQFNNLDITTIANEINICHKEAGIKQISTQDITIELSEIRTSIRTIITEKLSKLQNNDYIEFATIIAENYLESNENGVIIEDIIDQYELRMQSQIDESSNLIIDDIHDIEKLESSQDISTRCLPLINSIKDWNAIVLPLQIRSSVSGLEHPASNRLANEVRALTLFLHNEKHFTELALKISDEMEEAFSEISELKDMFADDYSQLSEIEETNRQNEKLIGQLEEFKDKSEGLIQNSYPTDTAIDDYISRMKELNCLIIKLKDEIAIYNDLRERICLMARGVAIQLHNEREKTDLALKIIMAIKSEFYDLSSLKDQIEQDAFSLNIQSMRRKALNINQSLAPTRRQKNKSLLWLGILIIVILMLVGLSKCSANTKEINHVEKYTVTLDKEGGSGGSEYITAERSSHMPHAYAPSRPGYRFDGYYSSPKGYGTKYYDSNMNSIRIWNQKSDATLYANWIKNNIPSNYSNKTILNKDNFETYFVLKTEAILDGNKVIVNYSIKPKSISYARSINSSDTISLQIGVSISSSEFYYGEPAYNSRHNIVLRKSNDYSKSGSFSFIYSSVTETAYWVANVTTCTGAIDV